MIESNRFFYVNGEYICRKVHENIKIKRNNNEMNILIILKHEMSY